MNTKRNHIQNWPELAREAKWSASTLAKKCGVCVRTLERHFKKEMKVSPKTWLNQQRQTRALELLRDGSTVKESAFELGYKHPNQFSREFRKYWGHSPASPIPVHLHFGG